MYEQYLLVMRYVRKVWLHRHIAFAIAAVVSLVGWAVVLAMPNVYEASARVYVDRNSMMSQLLRGIAADTSSVEMEFLRVARTTLTSRPNLERVARETDLALTATTPLEMDRLLERIKDKIGLKASGTRRSRDNLVTISFEHRDRQVALAVVRSLLDIFMESVLGSSQRDSATTEGFLEQQIQEYRRRMDEAEGRLKAFRRANVARLPTEGSGFFREYQTAAAKVKDLEVQLRAARRQRAVLQQRIDQLEAAGVTVPVPLAFPGAAPVVLDEQARLRSELAELRRRYTDNHPDVQAILKQLGEAAPPQDGETSESAEPSSSTRGLMLEELTVQLTRTTSQIAAIEAEMEVNQERMQQMLDALTSMPELEAELARLTREFEMNRRQYETFLERKESAEISREANLSADQDVFSIIDPPHVPELPVGPPRALLLTAVFVVACALGGGVAFVISLIQDSYCDAAELRERTGMLVLGRVGVVRTPREAWARRMSYIGFLGGAAVLGSAYAYLMLAVGLDVLPAPAILQLSGAN